MLTPISNVNRLICIMSLILFITTSYAQEVSQNGLDAYKSGNFKKAIKTFDKAEKSGNSTYLNFYYRGLSHLQLNQMQNAYNDFSKSINLKPDFGEAYFQRGTMILMPKFANESINDLNMAIKYAKADTTKYEAYANRASAKLMQGNVESAIKDCQEVLKTDSTKSYAVAALITLANCLDYQKKYEESEKILRKLYLRDSTDMAIISNLGFTLSKVDRHQEAIYFFDRALKLKPNSAFPLSNKSYSLMKIGKLQEALTCIRQSIAADPENSYAYKNLGEILLALELKAEACDAFKEALRRGFTDMYGSEVNELLAKHCKK